MDTHKSSLKLIIINKNHQWPCKTCTKGTRNERFSVVVSFVWPEFGEHEIRNMGVGGEREEASKILVDVCCIVVGACPSGLHFKCCWSRCAAESENGGVAYIFMLLPLLMSYQKPAPNLSFFCIILCLKWILTCMCRLAFI